MDAIYTKFYPLLIRNYKEHQLKQEEFQKSESKDKRKNKVLMNKKTEKLEQKDKNHLDMAEKNNQSEAEPSLKITNMPLPFLSSIPNHFNNIPSNIFLPNLQPFSRQSFLQQVANRDYINSFLHQYEQSRINLNLIRNIQAQMRNSLLKAD